MFAENRSANPILDGIVGSLGLLVGAAMLFFFMGFISFFVGSDVNNPADNRLYRRKKDDDFSGDYTCC